MYVDTFTWDALTCFFLHFYVFFLVEKQKGSKKEIWYLGRMRERKKCTVFFDSAAKYVFSLFHSSFFSLRWMENDDEKCCVYLPIM